MSIQSIVSLSCFKDINEALGGKPARAINDFLDLLRHDVNNKNHKKYVVLRDKATGALTFFFVFDNPDTDFGMLFVYARSTCVSKPFVLDNPNQTEHVLSSIENSHRGEQQFDWIGYGNFWLSTFDKKDQLVLEYNYPVLHDESRAYWHDGLSEIVRDNLATLFGVYVAMNFTLRRQSQPRQQSREEVEA